MHIFKFRRRRIGDDVKPFLKKSPGLKKSPAQDKILVGDVGGTNVRLGLAWRDKDGVLRVEKIEKLPGDNYASLSAAIEEYLGKVGHAPKTAALALAGPVKNGRVSLTNRAWTVDKAKLGERFKFQSVYLYNDFAAMARAVPECAPADFTTLNEAVADPNAPIVVAGPGTGFGMASLVPDKGGWIVLPSEGGHQAYAPQTPKETEILHILQRDYEFVSLELVSSGRGMDAVYQAVCTRLGQPYHKLPPQEIRDRAVAGDRACLDVCEIRADAIMGAIGDMALAIGARGGVVLAGGVAKRLLEFIDTPTAMARYFNRGPRGDYVKTIPVKVLQKTGAALYGVAALGLAEK
ncbi:MAG: glucokinase [Robiginitomaculum sp.]